MPFNVQHSGSTFWVFLSGEETNRTDGLPTLEFATYNCRCEKHGNSRFLPHTCVYGFPYTTIAGKIIFTEYRANQFDTPLIGASWTSLEVSPMTFRDSSERKRLFKKGNLERSSSENNGIIVDKRYATSHSGVKISMTQSRTEIQRNVWTSTSLPSSSRTRSDAVIFGIPRPTNMSSPPRERGLAGSNTFRAQPSTPSVPPHTPRNETHNKTKYKVKKSNKYFDNIQNASLPIYQTHSKNRGRALIVNNVRFHKEELYRKGAKKDEKDIADVLKQIGFDVERYCDVKKTDIKRILKRFTNEPKLKKADICLVVVMSHGTNNKIPGGYTELLCVEGEKISTEEIIDYFDESECILLRNKPKVFIFQCCRNSPYENDKIPANKKPQDKSNTLIAYSTIPGFASNRHVEDGTWYIQTICKVFSEHAHEYHIEDLLKMVDNEMKNLDSNLKQVSSYENRGFSLCYLHPR